MRIRYLNSENGLLIEDCEDIDFIAATIKKALDTESLLHTAFEKNMKLREQLEYHYIKKQVLKAYNSIAST